VGAVTAPLFDVIEVSDSDPNDVRLIAEAKDERTAEAIIGMAVLRRGVKDSYFTTRPHAKTGDER
jgi:hypothetical protein